jgi:radical SAM superfamily enzyme YgiQ (UPF0313 family)
MAIDVLFIHPGDHKKTYQDLSKEFSAIAMPVWTLLLANYIRKKGYSTAIYDVNMEGWDETCASELINSHNPNLIVMMVYGHHPSASTQTMPAAGKIARDIKAYNKDIPILFGGTHPSALPERTLLEEPIDYVAQGEGFYTIEGLIKYLQGKSNIQDIKGLWYKNNNSVFFTSPAQVIVDLDEELDGYAWDLLPNIEKYRAHNMHCFQDFYKSQKDDFSDVRSPYAVIYTSLGCPYSCHYCCINAVYGKSLIRYWSLERVISWIDTLVTKYGIRNIRFDDELFILSPKRVERFCDMMIERSYDVNIGAYARVDTIRDTLLKKLKKAGVNWLYLGIESGNEKVRADVNKNIKRDIKSVVGLVQNHDIYVLGNYMFGLPEDNLETMQDTLNLAIELNCEFANFYTVMPYPGSKLYETVQQQKEYSENWHSYSQHSYETLPMPTKYLQPHEVLRYRDDAFQIYHSNPKYLNMIKKKFGERVQKHIEKMLSVKIKRKLLDF